MASTFRDLLEAQKREALDALVTVGLDLSDFDWERVKSLTVPDTEVPRLFHRSRRYFFRFDLDQPRGYVLTFSPGVNEGESTERISLGWSSVIHHVRAWANALRQGTDGDSLRQAKDTVDVALLDTLVPLGNRRAFEKEVSEALSLAEKSGDPVSLVRADVDHFKQVNDLGGHSLGDEALLEIAHTLEACVRSKGTAYRVSGDEFTVLLPNHTEQEAIAVAERIRVAVNAREMTSRSLTLSLSLGVALFPAHARTLAELDQAAHTAAIEAKNLGRDLVRVFGEPKPEKGPRKLERKTADPTGQLPATVGTPDAEPKRKGSTRPTPHCQARSRYLTSTTGQA